MTFETDLREQPLEDFIRGLLPTTGAMVIKPTHMVLNEAAQRAVENIWAQATVYGTGMALLTAPSKRKKRTSRRRWKARARLGRLIPKMMIVEHQLEELGLWRYLDFSTDAAYLVLEDR
jgi:hypothetical protein